jgi:hypothetical protein
MRPGDRKAEKEKQGAGLLQRMNERMGSSRSRAAAEGLIGTIHNNIR